MERKTCCGVMSSPPEGFRTCATGNKNLSSFRLNTVNPNPPDREAPSLLKGILDRKFRQLLCATNTWGLFGCCYRICLLCHEADLAKNPPHTSARPRLETLPGNYFTAELLGLHPPSCSVWLLRLDASWMQEVLELSAIRFDTVTRSNSLDCR